MRLLLITAFLFITNITFGRYKEPAPKFRIIKNILTDINGDGSIDTITISSSVKEKTFFNKISISLSGYKKQTFYAKDSWTTVDKWFLDSNKNSVNSKLLFLKKTNKHSVIILFGEIDGAGYRGEFSILNIENNAIKMVFDHCNDAIDVELPKKVIDLENNGRLCFIYTTLREFDGFSTRKNADIGSYNPYFVYPVNDTCKLNKLLTKKFNQQYYVFAGFKYNDKIRILYPRNGGRPSVYKQ